jgi:amidohydrolase
MALDPALYSDLLAGAESEQAPATKLRRHLHRHPELGLQLPTTQAALLTELDGLGLEITTGTTSTGIRAVLRGDQDGPTMLLRADMDALPLHEDADIDFASGDPDTMHACGHDLHVSMLVGAARLLHARRKDLTGHVAFMFQPGEEGFHGAKHMLDEGLLDGIGTVDRAFAIHVGTTLPTGHVAVKRGSLMASADQFHIVVTGRGGHASSPHHALDPIPVACEIVLSLQQMITRRIDAFDPGVVTVGRISAGTTNNVIPETAEIIGTIRAVSERTRAKIHEGITRVAEGIAAAHDAKASVELVLGYPVTINDDFVADEVARMTGALFGTQRAHIMPNPVMGAEDWSYVLQRVPGAMAFLGATPPGVDPFTAAPNHSNRVRFDEATMSTGIALYAAMALDHLG